jgi:3-oxoacyl-[acyl-carrier protein] reductase
MSTPGGGGSRVALVTGGSGGIGRACAQRLAAAGMSVAVHYGGSAGPAEETVRAIVDAGGQAFAVQADVAGPEPVAAMFDEVERRFGGLDVLVHTAGIMLLAPLVELDLADFDRMHRTNLRGTFVVAQQAARRLRPGGAVVTFSTSVVRLAFPTYAAYNATKGGVEAMTLILARELRGRDITVNAVAPGPTATPLFLDGKDQQTIDRLAEANPLGRLGQPADVAEVVAFLAGPGRWVNGQVVHANGGAA